MKDEVVEINKKLLSSVKRLPVPVVLNTAVRDSELSDSPAGVTVFNLETNTLQIKQSSASNTWSESLFLAGVPISSSRALTVDDLGVNLICDSASEIVLTIPLNLFNAIGSSFQVTRIGSGNVKIISDNGVSINNVNQGEFSITEIHASAYAQLVLSNEFVISKTSVTTSLQNAYDGGNSVQLSDGNPIEISSYEQQLSGTLPVIVSGGTGYTVNDILTVIGGTFSEQIRLIVTGESGGVITSIAPIDAGSYSIVPANPVSTTGGSGNGGTFNLTYEPRNFTRINNIMSVAGPLSVGRQGFVPNYAIAAFGTSVVGDERGIVVGGLGDDEESRLLAKSPTNSTYWYNATKQRWRTAISSTGKTLLIEDDVPVTTKGDLLTINDSGSPARLPVGPDNYFLNPNSLAAEGIEWTPNLMIPGNLIEFTGGVLNANYAPQRVSLIVAHGNITKGDLLRQSLDVPFAVSTVPAGGGADNITIVAVALEDGTDGNPVRVSGASLMIGRLDSITTSTLSMTLGISQDTPGALEADNTAGAIGAAAEVKNPGEEIFYWGKLNEQY